MHFEMKNNLQPKARFELVQVDPEDPYLSMGIGLSIGYALTSYRQPIQNISLSDKGITLKLGLRVPLLSNKLWADGKLSGFLNTENNSRSIPPAHFFDANARLGYQLPISIGNLEWSTYLGTYLWKMLVKDEAYGIKFLSGPQVFLTARTDSLAKTQFFGHFKYAMMVNTDGSIKFSDRDFAIGGGIQIFRFQRRPVFLSLDIDQMNFSAIDSNFQLSLLTTSMGLSIEL
jgi:hypothetical protein